MFSMDSEQSLRLTHPPVQWTVRSLCLVIKQQGMKVTTYVHLVLRLRMRGSVLPFPPCDLIVWLFIKRRDNFVVTHWRVKGQAVSCRLGSECCKGSGHRTEQPSGQNRPVDELVCDLLLVLLVMCFWTRSREESGKEVEPVDLQSTARCKKRKKKKLFRGFSSAQDTDRQILEAAARNCVRRRRSWESSVAIR